MPSVPFLDLVTRLGLATLLGGVLGLEREIQKKPAGLRTHMMVSLGAASFTVLTLEVLRYAMSVMTQTRADPIRLIQGIIGGIGFLGAGSIIRSRGSVEGVTTAAGIWVVGAIGIACGMGCQVIAALTLGYALIILAILGIFEKLVLHSKRAKGGKTKEGPK